MGKAKPAKHTAAELARKAKDATQNKGGGKAGLIDRKGGSAGHQRYRCKVCGQSAPDMKTMSMHFESKHPKLTCGEETVEDVHAAMGGVTTQGVAVRGGRKK